MGEAKRKRAQAATVLPQLQQAVPRISAALRKLVSATGSQIGSDCYLHAALGQALLADLGIESRAVTGFAAWRLGPGDGDVIGHAPHTQGYLPPGEQGFAYHAWLECAEHIIDFTTYQLRVKAAALDAADGGHTAVEWCPHYLLLPKTSVTSYEEVANAHGAGFVYYEARPVLDVVLRPGFVLDPGDLAVARHLLDQPETILVGPNDVAGRRPQFDEMMPESKP